MTLSRSLTAARRRLQSAPNPQEHGAERLPVAALFVSKGGVYYGLPGVDPWDQDRDARLYAGPHPVVAHPPCERWGRFWHGSTRKPHQYELGADDGCFAAALAAVRRWSGVLEHPEGSHAWRRFGLSAPPRDGGWIKADDRGGATCCVEQGHYGHLARKATWLYAHGVNLPELRWGRGAQRLHPVALAKHGYEKARRIGMMAMVGGKNKTLIRAATPVEFRDVLIAIARSRVLGSPPIPGEISPDDAGPGAAISRHRGCLLAETVARVLPDPGQRPP
jgi:hypothetical protein